MIEEEEGEVVEREEKEVGQRLEESEQVKKRAKQGFYSDSDNDVALRPRQQKRRGSQDAHSRSVDLGYGLVLGASLWIAVGILGDLIWMAVLVF